MPRYQPQKQEIDPNHLERSNPPKERNIIDGYKGVSDENPSMFKNYKRISNFDFEI